MSVASGTCVRCQGEIPAERIAALPETKLCVECSQAVGGEERRIGIPENLAKAGSLKKNYGGVTVVVARRALKIEE